MQFEQYISHPAATVADTDTLLIGEDGRFDSDGHLKTVATRMDDVCDGHTLNDGTPAEPIATIIGLTHDFAKLTRWVQQYLRGHSFKRGKEYRYHQFPSALVTLYCVSEISTLDSEYAAELATLVVAGHHNTRSPPDPSAVSEDYGRLTNAVQEKYERVNAQFEDIDDNASALANRIISEATDGAGSWTAFKDWHEARSTPIDDVHDHLIYFDKLGDTNKRDGYYDDLIRLWTALKFADQTAASGIDDTDLGGVLPEQSALEAHIDSLPDGDGVLAELNDLREQARTDVTANIDALVDSDNVGLITLPTGFGKTYAGLSAGLEAANINDSRLLYVLPYTSILDQTAQEIQSIFDVSPYSKAFTLHHHLSDTYTGLGDRYTDADIGRSPGALHAESWLSGLTLTTTVQLFESLTAPTARQATRIPSLDQAVVVVDEPQAIPESWWQIVPILIEILVNSYDATVILMTATQPGLLKYGSNDLDTQELTDDTDQYREFLAAHPRVTYRIHDTVSAQQDDNQTPLSYPDAGAEIAAVADNQRDVLAVCNTRASAEELYRQVISNSETGVESPVELGSLIHDIVKTTGTLPSPAELRQRTHDAIAKHEINTIYAFLSGDIRPDDRALIIDALYNDDVGGTDAPEPLLDTDQTVILISTSVVEAGVDVSFDTVFRDYAPIPNIVQSGGRCNRSFGGDTGSVIVWRLAEPPDGHAIPSLVIHGGDGGDALPLLRETGRVLREYVDEDGVITESAMVSDTVDDFYSSLFEGPLDPGDETLAQAVRAAAINELESEHMISEIETYDDVIAVLTDTEQQELLTGELTIKNLSKFAGAQVNTNVESYAREMEIGNSLYLLVDARADSYDPVFGVR